jgi:hypothetical protein
MRKTPAQRAIEFAENPNKLVAPSLATKFKTIGAGVLLAVGSMVGIDRARGNDEAPVPTGTQTGQMAGENLAKADEISTPLVIDNPDVMIPGNDGHGTVENVRGTESPSVDPAVKEAETYEHSDAFANNDGQGAVETEQAATKPEIGDAITVVKGQNGEVIHVDPVTGQPLPESEQHEG